MRSGVWLLVVSTALGLKRRPILPMRLQHDLRPFVRIVMKVFVGLWRLLKPRLAEEHLVTVYETLERPLVPVLADMEMAGVRVDAQVLSRMSNAFAQKMAGLEAEIQELAGQPFNVGSPKQLGEIFYDVLGVPGGTKGKAGAYSTGADVLEDITLMAEEHPKAAELAGRVLDWRQIAKLKSTYTDALQTHVNPETGRVHTSYSIAGANTGLPPLAPLAPVSFDAAMPSPVASPATRPSARLRRMHSNPIGPTGAAMAKPIRAPVAKALMPYPPAVAGSGFPFRPEAKRSSRF